MKGKSKKEAILERLVGLLKESDGVSLAENLEEAWRWVEEQVEEQEEEIHELRRSLVLHKAMTESLGEGAVVLDGDGRVTYANPAAQRQLMPSGNDLQGRDFHALVHPPGICDEEDSCLLSSALDVGAEIHSAEEEFSFDGAGPVSVMFTLTRVVGGLEDGAVLVFRDVSELQQMYAQLLAADRLVAVGTLASGIAHEINNPLAYLQANVGFAAQALEQLEFENAQQVERVREALLDAQEGIDRIKRIVEGMRTFTHGGGKEVGIISVDEALQAALSICGGELSRVASVERRGEELGELRGSRQLLVQVFVNLFLNAAASIRDLGTEDREPDIKGGLVEVITEVEGRRQRVVVVDNGKGIPHEVVKQIFDPFFTTREVGGSGLGLYMCRAIVNEMGGSITVESEPGEGARFIVELPKIR